MEHNPFWGANTLSVLRILWNPKVLYWVPYWPTFVPNMTHIKPVHDRLSYLRSISILSPHLTSVSSKWSPCFTFPHKKSMCLGTHTESKIYIGVSWMLSNYGSRSDSCWVLNGAWVEKSDQSNSMKSCTDLAMLCRASLFPAVLPSVRFVAFEWN